MAAPIGAPLPGCRSGMAATWVMPSRAATWWHCVTASDSIQLPSEANTATEADFCSDKISSSGDEQGAGRHGTVGATGGCSSVRHAPSLLEITHPRQAIFFLESVHGDDEQ